jgi:hypothetical protein
MDDPTPRSKKDRETECVFRGFRSQARAPFFFRLWRLCDNPVSSFVAPAFRRAHARFQSVGLKADATKELHTSLEEFSVKVEPALA